MISLTLQDIAEITDARLVGADPAAVVTGSVEFDSRKVAEGGLFVALPGERVDGHRFAQQAITQGAVAVLAAREVDAPAVVVDTPSDDDKDVFNAVVDALSKLATEVARRLVEDHGLRIVGVTGSAGKTSTKDFMKALFSAAGDTVAPPGSFNNELGHPYTVLQCSERTRFLVAEMSARGIGHIAHLAEIAPPHIGTVLNVGTAHLGEFGSRGNIARAKAELVEALPAAEAGGIAVLNADDPFVDAMAERTSAKIVRFSTAQPPASGADYRATDIELDDVARASFNLHGPGFKPQKVRLKVFGAHQVSNALAAAASAIEAGVAPGVVVEKLNNHHAASAHRMDVETRSDGLTVINDAYNANPESMRAGIAALAYTTAARTGARAIAVLGEMNELGDDAREAHEHLAEELSRFHIEHLVAVGGSEMVHAMARRAKELGIFVDEVADVDAAAQKTEEIAAANREGADVVLVKASNSAQLWQVAQQLLAQSGGGKQ